MKINTHKIKFEEIVTEEEQFYVDRWQAAVSIYCLQTLKIAHQMGDIPCTILTEIFEPS